jgi:hypothetical protein
MEPIPADRHRIWSHAALGGLAILCIPILIASIGWVLGIDRDVDMSSVFELIFTLLMILTTPALALAFGVLAPSAIAFDRITRGRTTRLANMLLGVSLSLPLFVAFVFGTALFMSDDRPYVVLVLRGLSIPQRHPGVGAALLAVFAAAGVIAALGMRHRSRLSS